MPLAFSGPDAPAWDDAAAWREAAGGADADAWLLLADPSAVPAEQWLATWGDAFPDAPCFGGLASGGRSVEDMFVFRDRELLDGGVALGFRGGVKIRTLVSQGCRPIGEALPVTGVEENVIQSLGSRPAWRILDDAFQGDEDHPIHFMSIDVEGAESVVLQGLSLATQLHMPQTILIALSHNQFELLDQFPHFLLHLK
jgi:small ligand-binding sensory domain FIST